LFNLRYCLICRDEYRAYECFAAQATKNVCGYRQANKPLCKGSHLQNIKEVVDLYRYSDCQCYEVPRGNHGPLSRCARGLRAAVRLLNDVATHATVKCVVLGSKGWEYKYNIRHRLIKSCKWRHEIRTRGSLICITKF